jgi:elongation factor P
MEYTDLTAGAAFKFEGNPYIVVSSEFKRMQMRKAVVRTTVRNLITGQLIPKTFTAGDRIEPADVTTADVQFLYHDGDMYHFMDIEKYEQYHATDDILGEKVVYLTEHIQAQLVLFENNPVQLIVPKKVTLKVIESPVAIKGDSVSNTFKTVTCENGVKISCPLFIKEGESIVVNTETGEYDGRA